MERNAIYLITGPMASGKSTIAELVASSLPKAVHLRGDIFRRYLGVVVGAVFVSIAPNAWVFTLLLAVAAFAHVHHAFEHGVTLPGRARARSDRVGMETLRVPRKRSVGAVLA